MAAALLALGFNLALRIGAVFLALIGLAGCVTASWYAVSRRGLVRLLGAVGALTGLAALITGLVLTVISVWIVVAVAALALISVLSARYALRRTPKALRSRDRAARGPSPVDGGRRPGPAA